jgi:nucleoside-diphosphate-sugar epimerase
MSTERFLITGALGCIGAWTVRNLVREGVPTVVFDLGRDPHRLTLIMTPDELAKVTFVHGDITDLAALEQAIDGHAITHLIHLAALQLPFVKANSPLGARVNVVGTVNVFEAVARRKERIGRVVYAIGLRPATVYGPGRDQGITSAPTKAILAAAFGQPFHIPYGGRGEFHYADDVAKAFIACARVPFAGAEIFNLHGSVAQMGELVAAIEAAAPESHGQITFAEPGFPSPDEFDATPLTKLIGPLPHTPLRQGVAATSALFRERIAEGQLTMDALQ